MGFGGAVGDEGDLFLGLDAQAGGDGGTGAGREFGGKVQRKQMGCGFKHGYGRGSSQATGNSDAYSVRLTERS